MKKAVSITIEEGIKEQIERLAAQEKRSLSNMIEILAETALDRISASEELEHLRSQLRGRYEYLVGEWAGARRAKSTQTGEFVSTEVVTNYLNGD